MNSSHSASMIVIAALALCATACAQFPEGHGGRRGGMNGADREARGGAGAMPYSPGALVARQLDRLEDELKPGPAQRDAWNAYADKVQQLADDVTRVRSEARTSPVADSNAERQLDRIDAGMQIRAKRVAEIAALGRALYATLTPAQKAIADRELALPVVLLAVGIEPSSAAEGSGGAGRRP
jgi:hypothetical protein